MQVIEELMSIADGQVVLQRDADTGAVSVDPQASISRIGARAYPPALADLAIQLRFELAQVLPVCACLVLPVHGMHLHGTKSGALLSVSSLYWAAWRHRVPNGCVKS